MEFKRITYHICSVLCMIMTLLVSVSSASDVLIIGDARIKPVAELTHGLRRTLRGSSKIYSISAVKNHLRDIVEQENAKIVVALGPEALSEAQSLPTSIPVLYDLVVSPPVNLRSNTSGFFIATPPSEYAELFNNYFPSFKSVAVLGRPSFINSMEGSLRDPFVFKQVNNAAEFVRGLKNLQNTNALLLIPDPKIVSSSSLSEALLFSFRHNIPLLGISESDVRQGTLLALIVNLPLAGRELGEMANKAIKTGRSGPGTPSPHEKFNIILNIETARKLGINVPDSLVRSAQKVYP